MVCNRAGDLLWARRIGQDAWQFPQGGIRRCENPEQALYRELEEELGLKPQHVKVIGCTRGWLRYRLPRHLVRRGRKPLCIGQKQRWFLLELVGSEQYVRLNLCAKPEFDCWRWVSYWYPLQEVVAFKRRVYELALHELAPLLFGTPAPSAVCSRTPLPPP
jgi:putative (di)nucleoside polyphosphate hydrolase